MKKKVGKGVSFTMAFFGLLAIYFVTLFQAPDVLKEIGGTIVLAIAVAGGIFQVANVADNGVKGKFYNEGLARKEDQ